MRDSHLPDTGVVTGLFVLLFRMGLDLLGSADLSAALLLQYPGGVFYVVYDCLLCLLLRDRRSASPGRLWLVFGLCDFCSNILNLLLSGRAALELRGGIFLTLAAKAYLAGVDFFIQKPINLIEVSQVIGNVAQQLKSEKTLASIRSVFQEEQPASQVGVSALCGMLGTSPRSMEQRARRAAERGLRHVASLGLEDYNNEIFTRCATQLFPFQEVRAEMSFLQGRGQGRR